MRAIGKATIKHIIRGITTTHLKGITTAIGTAGNMAPSSIHSKSLVITYGFETRHNECLFQANTCRFYNLRR